jgi:hypothetical protein
VAYIKEQVSKRLITIEMIPTKLNPADILSKPTYGSDFVNKRNKALVGSCDTITTWISTTQCKLLAKTKTKKKEVRNNPLKGRIRE